MNLSIPRSYSIFLFLLPLLFLNGIGDTVLLPRQLLLTAFTALLLIGVLRGSKKNPESFRLDAAPLAMVLYFVIAAVVSLCNANVLSESLYFLSKLWILISFLLLTLHLLGNNSITVFQITNAVVFFGCAAILTALMEIAYKTMLGKELLRGVHQIAGNFANKNLLSSILFLCVPFFMIGGMQKMRFRYLSYSALVLAILILLIIRTRTVLIATFIFFAIVTLFFLRDVLKRKIWWVVALLLAVSIVLFFQLGVMEAIGGLQSSADIKQQYFYRLFYTGTVKERLLFWQNSYDMFREYPFGVGLGNWQIYFPKYGLEKFDYYEITNGIHTLQRPHNDFLWVLCETGILGFAAYVSIFAIIIYQTLSLIKSAATKSERQSFIYLFSAVIGYIVIAFFDFPMERIEHQILLLLLFAIIIHRYRLQNNKSFSLPIHKIAVTLFITLGICFSFTIAWQRLESERQVLNLDGARKAGYDDGVLSYAQKAENSSYKIDSRTIPIKWYMGTAYFSKQKFAESEACFKEAYVLTPYNINAINNLASCYEVNGKRKDAIEMYLKALHISPHFEEARLNLAAVYFNDKSYEKAFRTVDSCSIDTRDPKYKTFLPPILKAKVEQVIKGINFPISAEMKNNITNLQDFSQLYYESKKNNVTFEQQIIKYLKK